MGHFTPSVFWKICCLLWEYIDSFKYGIKSSLDIISKRLLFFDSSLYKELSKEEQEEINIIYDNYKSNLVKSITHAENFYNEAFNEKKNTKN